MSSKIVALLLCLLPLFAESPEARRWWSHIEFLADDKLQGRDTGSEGHKQAALYIAQEFERAGLRPAGTEGYRQPVKFRSQSIDESHSSLQYQFLDTVIPLELGEDAYFSMRAKVQEEVRAGLVFAGYGFAVPEKQFDELAGLDLKGKFVVYVSGAPKNLPAPLVSHNQSSDERWKRLKAAGAVGIAIISNPKNSDIPWQRARMARFLPSMSLTDVHSDGPACAISINPTKANILFRGTDHTIEEIFDLADKDQPLPKFELKGSLIARQQLVLADLESDNVIGKFEGSHPTLKNEYLVLSAHLDHIGVGKRLQGDQIYNGAMDNASGIATLIEIARALKGKKLKRSILFTAVTGEEKGLLGSQYFVYSPTVPKEAVVADLNFDMFLPLFPFKRLTVYGVDESTLGATVRHVAEKASIPVQVDPDPQRNSFIRSDQYSFIRRGIPALAFKLGYLPNSPEEKIFKTWLRERYHSVTDDLQQPVDKEAAAKFNKLMVSIATTVANDDEKPKWLDSSFFKRFAQQ